MSWKVTEVKRRRRAPAAAVAVVLVLVAVLGAGAALAAAKPTLSIKVKSIVPYTKSAKLTGRLSSGKTGILIKLQQRVWPFKGAFKTVATTHTRAQGTYSFKQHPSLAAEYRALAPKEHARSATHTVYVVKQFKVLKCVLTGHGHTYPGCSRNSRIPHGRYKWRITLEFLYPASAFGKEKGKPVYTYYGIRRGEEKQPSTVKRQKTISQHANSASTTLVKFVKSVVVPSTAYFMEATVCTKTTEPQDGFGLPGAPGSHMCGRKTIPGNISIYKLG